MHLYKTPNENLDPLNTVDHLITEFSQVSRNNHLYFLSNNKALGNS